MKKFLARLFIFTLFPLSYWTIVGLTNYYFYTHDKLILEKQDVLIMGDSHIQKGIDSRLFASAENIAQPSEPLCISYWKLLKILENNTPKTLILGFSTQNIAAFNDYKFSDRLWSGEMFSRIYPIQKLDALDNYLSVDYSMYYKTLWLKTCFFPSKKHRNYMGGFANKNIDFKNNTDQTIKRHFYYGKQESEVSSVNINYLDSIVTLCQENNIRTILVSCPVYFEYYQQIPKKVMAQYEQLKLKYSEMDVLVIDKTKDFYPDSLMMDCDHLNLGGSQVFTREIVELL